MDTHIEFKRKIDNARNILVGAVPSPAGQIDQITFALIYKFMSDIDEKTARLPGGVRQYFVDEYEKYDWHNLMRLDGQDKLNRYRDALSKMSENSHLPELFRSIYQNAFLPYNDPRTLNLFLKEIDGFAHSRNDAIGDAYEYLLSITGAQGDVGQFRTPRHIIKFIVDVVQPGKGDTVLDPACGTAGFLIAAYNYVRMQHDGVDEDGNQNGEQRLTASERQKMHGNYYGYDIDPTMVRTATVNMYLHGFSTPNIEIHDTLTSEEHWANRYDVILANPPFMTPKGGIEPHGKFGVKANRAEVLFVDYIASHLKPNGRAGIIVPEGIIFQSGNAYKELRKNLVENSLYAVVSLPSGVFQPYTGVKTSILLLDSKLAKQQDEILFVDISHTGVSLGATGRKIDDNDFPDVEKIIAEFKSGVEIVQSHLAFPVSRDEIRATGTYDLKQSTYRKHDVTDHDIEFVAIKEIAEVRKGKSSSTKTIPGKYELVLTAKDHKTADHYDIEGDGVAVPLISALGHGKADIKRIHRVHGKFALANLMSFIEPKNKDSLDPGYLFYVLDAVKGKMAKMMSGAANVSMNVSDVENFKIPLPPIEIQREIVAELDGYRKIIDAAQTIVKTYKPTIKIDPEWQQESLGELTQMIGGGTPSRTKENYWGGDIKWITSKYFSDSHTIIGWECITDEGLKKSSSNIVPKGSTIVITRVSVGKYAYADHEYALNQDLTALVSKNLEVLDSSYLFRAANLIAEQVKKSATGIGVTGVTRQFLSEIKIPLPPIEIQRKIVTELEAEAKLIDANKKLIEIYTQKIKSKIAEVWGE